MKRMLVNATQEEELRVALVDGQKLAVAQRPVFRREGEGEDADFREKRFGHGKLGLGEIEDDLELKAAGVETDGHHKKLE